MNDRDIEHYLASLEGGWLSEDDMEMSDEEEENVPESYNRDELLNMLGSDEEDSENPQNQENDPSLIESEVIDNLVIDNGTFRNELAFVLCNTGAAKENTRGRPSSSVPENEIQTINKRSAVVVAPPKEVQRDGQSHWPLVGGSLRCKYPYCKGYSTIHCSKCKVNLCLNTNNNCYNKYHNE